MSFASREGRGTDREKPLLILNLKSYSEIFGGKAVEIGAACVNISEETDTVIAVCPPLPWLSAVSETGILTFAQHTDALLPGAHTGYTSPEMMSRAGARGTLLNHSEHRLRVSEIEFAVKECRRLGMYTTVCADTPETAAALSVLRPDAIAIEPPELIGTGISVSNARPEVITDAVKSIRSHEAHVRIIAGAGITLPEDVSSAVMLGAEGALVASAIIKSADWKGLIRKMALALRP